MLFIRSYYSILPSASSLRDVLFATLTLRVQQGMNALVCVVEILAEENCNDEKCFMEQPETATNHPYCQASYIYEINECFYLPLLPPKNGIVYVIFPGIWFHACPPETRRTGFLEYQPKTLFELPVKM